MNGKLIASTQKLMLYIECIHFSFNQITIHGKQWKDFIFFSLSLFHSRLLYHFHLLHLHLCINRRFNINFLLLLLFAKVLPCDMRGLIYRIGGDFNYKTNLHLHLHFLDIVFVVLSVIGYHMHLIRAIAM